jgi:hypothetical protein
VTKRVFNPYKGRAGLWVNVIRDARFSHVEVV